MEEPVICYIHFSPQRKASFGKKMCYNSCTRKSLPQICIRGSKEPCQTSGFGVSHRAETRFRSKTFSSTKLTSYGNAPFAFYDLLGDARGCCNWGLGAKGGGHSRHIDGCWVDNTGFFETKLLNQQIYREPRSLLV